MSMSEYTQTDAHRRATNALSLATAKLLATCKVLMRDRRGIDVLLTLEVRL